MLFFLYRGDERVWGRGLCMVGYIIIYTIGSGHLGSGGGGGSRALTWVGGKKKCV